MIICCVSTGVWDMGLTICDCFGVGGITLVVNEIYRKHDGKKCDGPVCLAVYKSAKYPHVSPTR
jgi:hypothetical protein